MEILRIFAEDFWKSFFLGGNIYPCLSRIILGDRHLVINYWIESFTYQFAYAVGFHQIWFQISSQPIA